MLNRYDYSFYIDGLPAGPLLYCTQEQYSSLMNPPFVFVGGRTHSLGGDGEWGVGVVNNLEDARLSFYSNNISIT